MMYHKRSPQLIVSMLITLLAFVVPALSQTERKDVLYLKNGSVIRGVVLEQIPGKTVKIETADGSIFVFGMDEVERIVKEDSNRPRSVAAGSEASTGDVMIGAQGSWSQFSLVGGASVPVGDLAGTSGDKAGYAKFGFTVGGQFATVTSSSVFIALNLLYTSNPMDESEIRKDLGVPSSASADVTAWTMFAPTLAIGFGGTEGSVRPYIGAQAGAAFTSSPEISVSAGGVTVNQKSASATSFCYGVIVGLNTTSKVSISVSYLTATPKYSVTASAGGFSTSGEFEQSTSVIQITAGIGLN